MTRQIILALVLTVGLGFLAATAFAKTPDGRTPAEETICDDLSGAAFGLCNAYCEATDCGDGVNRANARACQSLRKNWTKHTGLREFPCECVEPDIFVPGQGCACVGPDLIVRILEAPAVSCPDGQGSCVHEVLIQVENVGSSDAVDPFSVLVELGGVGLSASEEFLGLAAGAIEQRFLSLGPGDNCYDPNCEVKATVDADNTIVECDENNTAEAEFLG